MTLPAQALRDSTHDFPTTPGEVLGDLSAVWADVKSPGTGLTVAVGTVEIRIASDLPPVSELSGDAIDLPPAVVAFPPQLPSWTITLPNPPRQVVAVRATDADGDVVFQTYFYGGTASLFNKGLGDGRDTNARGISIWPEEDPADTRIAICGETFDEQIPLSTITNPNATDALSGGFIAVYNGDGTLLWTDHLVAAAGSPRSSAVTDVSIRVEGGEDVVTYCGITTHGFPLGLSPGGSLAPLNAFAAPAAGIAGGAQPNAPDQWDGFVGRLTRAPGLAPVRAFHANVGGDSQDGLFGIAEIDADRFVVVGSTTEAAGMIAGVGFPLTNPLLNLNILALPYCHGTVTVFDAGQGPNLVLESSTPLGTLASAPALSTFAKDVLVQPFAVETPQGNREAAIHIVGSTNDANLFPNVPGQTINVSGSIQGVDGFLLSGFDDPASPDLTFQEGAFIGFPGVDSLSGVGAWSEFADHLCVFGSTTQASVDLFATQVFFDTGVPALLTPPPLPAIGAITTLRQQILGGGGLELEAAMGTNNALGALGLPFIDLAAGALGGPEGGGVSVDQQARCHVVGATDSQAPATYPVTAAPFNVGNLPIAAARHACRTAIDMLPPGVGRSDGTGTLVGGGAPMTLPLVGLTGSTTPTASLAEFGLRPTDPLPELLRMHFDYEGLAPAGGVAGSVLLARPAIDTNIAVGVIQLGPITPPITPLPANGLEVWVGGVTTNVFAFPPAHLSVRLPIGPFPAGVGQQYGMQAVCLLSNPLASTGFALAASPAIQFEY